MISSVKIMILEITDLAHCRVSATIFSILLALSIFHWRSTMVMKTLLLTTGLTLMLSISAQAQTRLPAQINLDNQRAANLTDLVISDPDGKAIGKISKPLAAGKKSVLKLAKTKGCEMSVQATFDDEGEINETLNLCKEKVLRFKD
jgi:hypothetical protein